MNKENQSATERGGRRTPKYDLEALRRRTVQFWTSDPVGISFGKTDYIERRGRGTGVDRGLPRYDYDDLAFIYRQRTSFAEALLLWKALLRRPSNTLNSLHWEDSEGEEKGRSDRDRRIQRFVELRRECAEVAERELSRRPDGQAAAQAAIENWCAEARAKIADAARRAEAGAKAAKAARRPEAKAKISEAARTASSKSWAELVPLREAVDDAESCLLRLLQVYRNPREFFQILGPKIRRDFDLEPWDWQGLAGTLHTWGYAALLNTKVREAFDAVAKSPRHFNEVLARIEQRGVHRDKGRPPSDNRVHKDRLRRFEHLTERLRRVRKEKGDPLRGAKKTVQEFVAHVDKVKSSAIRKSVTIARKMKSPR